MPLARDDLAALAREKLAAARLLLAHGHSATAYYVAGYAIELALKAHVSTLFVANELPDPRFARSVYTHDLDELLTLANLRPAYRERASDEAFAERWDVVRDWRVETRYLATGDAAAERLIAAIDSADGVLEWLLSYPWANESRVEDD